MRPSSLFISLPWPHFFYCRRLPTTSIPLKRRDGLRLTNSHSAYMLPLSLPLSRHSLSFRLLVSFVRRGREREHTRTHARSFFFFFLKLAELGYKRSSKKCKEKFENVHKYYKRTKEGRAGRQDGKSYRFFQELEALHAATAASQQQQHQHQEQLQLAGVAPPPQMHAFSSPQPMSAMPPPPGPIQPAPISSAAPAPAVEPPQPPPVSLQGLSFPSMSDSESDDDDASEDDDMTAETGGSPDGVGKRKRGGSKKMMAFFEGLMKQVIQRQEEMQQRFLETMEKREAERTAREEAWRRQEVARLNREQEQLAQERAAAASRDASIIAFLQRIGGQTVHVPPVVIPMPTPMQAQTPPPAKKPRQQLPPPPPSQATHHPQPKPIPAAPLQQQPPALQQQPPPQPPQHKETTHDEAGTPRSAPAPTSAGLSLALVPVATEQHVGEAAGLGLGGGESGGGASSSRWPKTEVHALIQLRMDMDNRYQENGPKGPLWEEISAGMRRLGYSRNSKRCKEKWENINKYFKKVKESNKRRPEDSKTCPYFHQLEAIYRKKHNGGGGSGAAANNAAVSVSVPAVAEHQNLNRHEIEIEIEGKKINDNDKRNNGGVGAAQVPTSNGQTTPTTATFDVDLGVKKPEDTVRELNEQPQRELTTDETDSDDMGDDYTDDGEDGEDDGKMQYRIQFQRPNPVGANNAPPPATTATTAAPTSTPSSSFLAMVQ
ncbi:trihelix transcription factor GTL1-like isoform X2 [Hordeum vulgare subsp. vulgare]|uniref:trihelix transcription factor GTL1-like isoform X2 n=1 Tax=Hordeum vulgare subsp. vulgare TaxID=112509 RepID=UPI001D1A5988|nr:trihelix transcription factor GTL1-like isoform X2 [Hordeum vulgare subsp. vulgare]